MITIEYVKSALEFAPKSPGVIAPNLRGWWIAGEGGDFYVCAKCAGRMAGRGCALGRDAKPVWADRAEPYGVCIGCEIDKHKSGILDICSDQGD